MQCLPPKKNGELLGLAEGGFDVLVNTGKGIPYQQNVSRFDLTVFCYARRASLSRTCYR